MRYGSRQASISRSDSDHRHSYRGRQCPAGQPSWNFGQRSCSGGGEERRGGLSRLERLKLGAGHFFLSILVFSAKTISKPCMAICLYGKMCCREAVGFIWIPPGMSAQGSNLANMRGESPLLQVFPHTAAAVRCHHVTLI